MTSRSDFDSAVALVYPTCHIAQQDADAFVQAAWDGEAASVNEWIAKGVDVNRHHSVSVLDAAFTETISSCTGRQHCPHVRLQPGLRRQALRI